METKGAASQWKDKKKMTFARKAFLKHCKAFKDENVQGCEKYEHGTQLSLTLSGRQETAGPESSPYPQTARTAALR